MYIRHLLTIAGLLIGRSESILGGLLMTQFGILNLSVPRCIVLFWLYTEGYMSSEFDPNTEFEFEENFSDELEDFDEFDIVNEGVSVRTAILQKERMVALLCIKSGAEGAAICRVDPREKLPAVQIYDDPSAALHWFSRSLRTSKVNGWNVIYDGLPLHG